MKILLSQILISMFIVIHSFSLVHAQEEPLPIAPPEGLVETTSCPITGAANSITPEPGDLGKSLPRLQNTLYQKDSTIFELVKGIVDNLMTIREKLKKSSKGGKRISKKIASLIKKMSNVKRKDPEDCVNQLSIVSTGLNSLGSQLHQMKCNTEVKEKEIKKELTCILSSLLEEITPILEESKNELETLLSNDTNGNLIADVCETIKPLTGNSTDIVENIGDIPELSGAFVKQIPNRFIIFFSELVNPFNLQTVIEELEERFKLDARHIYRGGNFPGINVVAQEGTNLISLLSQDPNVSKVVHDYAFKLDDLNLLPEDVQARMKYQIPRPFIEVQTIPDNIKWVEADRNLNEGDGCKVTVAVIDSGIYFIHPDLIDNLNRELSVDCRVKDPFGGCLPHAGNDDNGHGTNVAGVIAARDNHFGSLGVGSKIELISVKVVGNDGTGIVGDLIAGIDYVGGLSSEIEIANISIAAIFGETPTDEELTLIKALDDAIYRAINGGVVLVVAAGNENLDVEKHNVYPAKDPSVITVSALTDSNGIHNDGDEAWAFFGIDPLTMAVMSSNFGLGVDIIAPGAKIISTELGGGYSLPLAGTSFATPHVAGTIGLFIAKNGRPQSAEKNFLRPLFKAITKDGKLHRDIPYMGEPEDGFLEPAVYANGPLLQP